MWVGIWKDNYFEWWHTRLFLLILRKNCSFGYLVSSLCSSHMLQNVSKPWREETIHLWNPKASQQRFITADLLYGDKRVGWYKRPKESETRSRPGPAHINPGFMDLRLCVTDAVFESSFRFCPASPWSFHLFLSLVMQSSEMAELMKKIMNNKCLLAGFFYFGVRLLLWPPNHHSEMPPIDQITHCLWFHMKGHLSLL